jgi:hypothetical protein
MNTPHNSRNAGRKKLGRIKTWLPLDPNIKQALIEWAQARSMTNTAAANVLLAEALQLEPVKPGSQPETANMSTRINLKTAQELLNRFNKDHGYPDDEIREANAHELATYLLSCPEPMGKKKLYVTNRAKGVGLIELLHNSGLADF